MTFPFDNTYVRLPERFYARLPPTAVQAPKLIKINDGLARALGLDPAVLASDDGVAMLSGNRVPEGAEPLAMAYAGHQFGNWVPQLGDGRAVLLGEVIGRDGVRYDIQLKGSGPTPYSRRGDGRAALGPVLREYIVSEAMHALGVPTTRTLAAVLTGETILRQEGMLPGAVLARVSKSHVRVGTFEYFGNHGDLEGVRLLADYVRARLYPEVTSYRGLLEAVIARTAALVAQWQSIGFIHGVMNTDNVSVAGETIDYGPCAFMDAYDPNAVFSSIDQGGRYAFGNQPRIAHWNLVRLAQALMPLFDPNEEVALAYAQESINTYPALFQEAYFARLRAKFGLSDAREGDLELMSGFFKHMNDGNADFTLGFRYLADAAEGDDAKLRALFDNDAALVVWLASWRERLGGAEVAEAMRRVNPLFIPRNHRIEAVIMAATERGDFAPFEELLSVLARPFVEQLGFEDYANPPKPNERVLQTFCGT
ncbi:MAG: YdiU family protein [Alphaproteobacteria bacterium]|nr:YdiU family protein [Alphaproteobacteria bacterium]